MKLCDGLSHHTYLIKTIDLHALLKKRLETIGLYESAKVKVWQKKNSGTMVIMVSGGRWAIDRKISSGIEVKEEYNYV